MYVIRPLLTKDFSIHTGLCMLTWTSLNLNSFVESVYATLGEVDLMVNRVIDMIEFRIEKILDDIANTKLVELPTDTPWTIDEFIKRTEVSSNTISFYMLTFFGSVLTVKEVAVGFDSCFYHSRVALTENQK